MPSGSDRNKLGTFLGVFVPTLSTILGVVIFLRLTDVLGKLGFYSTLGVFSAGFLVALLTTLSICALVSIDEDKAEDGGGLYTAVLTATNSYFATIAGCLIYAAYVCGIAFYCLGFGEATKAVLDGTQEINYTSVFSWNSPGSWVVVSIAAGAAIVIALFVYLVGVFRSVMVTVGTLLVIVICLGTTWGFTLAGVESATAAAHTGNITGFSWDTFQGNLYPPKYGNETFQLAFASLFPGFTGVISGANLSGDLKNPVLSITRGTLFAVITAFLLYVAESFVAASSVPNTTLSSDVDGILQNIVDKTIQFPIAYIGILCTTLSSALSYMLGAPRLVEAMANDGLIPKVLGAQHGRANEPALALLITTILVVCIIMTGELNLLTPVVTAIFLLTFCMINVVCVSMTCATANKTRKVKFRCYSPWTALFGALLSFVAMIFCATSEALAIVALIGVVVCLLNFRSLRQWCRTTAARSRNASPRHSISLPQHDEEDEDNKHDDESGDSVLPSKPEGLHKKDEALIRLMSMVQVQHESEQPRNNWMRTWFPCIKEQSRKSSQSQLQSPLLSIGEIDNDDGIEPPDDETFAKQHAKYVSLAASRVRDAIAYKYRPSAWGSVRKLNAKKFFHQTKFFRTLVMILWFLLAFVEVPAWCFGDPSVRDNFVACLDGVPNFGIPLLKQTASFALDFLCILVIGGELFLKIRFTGRQSFPGKRWYIIQIFLIACYITSFLVVRLDDDCPINLCPIIRPLYFIAWSRRVREGFMTLVRTLPKLGGVLLLLVVHIILFATLGMICFKDTPEEPEFDHMLTAIMSLIVLLTTANFPDVMMGGYNSNRATAIFFIAFLIIGHLFLMNLVLATVVDSYQQQFAAKNAKKKRNSTKSLDVAFGILDFERKGVVEARALELLYRELQKHRLSLFKVSDEDRIHRDFAQMQDVTRERFGFLIEAMRAKRIGLVDENDEDADLYGPDDDEDNPTPRRTCCEYLTHRFPDIKQRLRHVFRSKIYKYSLNAFHGLTAIFSLVEAEIIDSSDNSTSSSPAAVYGMEYAQLVVTIVLAVDTVLKSFAMGCIPFWSSKRMAFDGVMISLCLLLDVVFLSVLRDENQDALIGIVTIARLLRSTRMLYSFKTTRAVLRTALRLVPDFVQLFGMLWAAVSFYAFVGISVYGGKIYPGNPALGNATWNSTFAESEYWANNFNDLGSALVTLFELLMVNNWQITMDGCTLALGTQWSILFFVTFWFITVVIMTNIVVASIIDGFFNSESLKDFKRLESTARQEYYEKQRELRLSRALEETADKNAAAGSTESKTSRPPESMPDSGFENGASIIPPHFSEPRRRAVTTAAFELSTNNRSGFGRERSASIPSFWPERPSAAVTFANDDTDEESL